MVSLQACGYITNDSFLATKIVDLFSKTLLSGSQTFNGGTQAN